MCLRNRLAGAERVGRNTEAGRRQGARCLAAWGACQSAWICSEGSKGGAADELDQICIFKRQLVAGKRVNGKGAKRVKAERPTWRPETTTAGTGMVMMEEDACSWERLT